MTRVFRRRVTEIINGDARMQVVGVASHGQEAIEKNEALRPDVITMDYEMPVMDGITAIRHIMRQRPVPILMFSSLTLKVHVSLWMRWMRGNGLLAQKLRRHCQGCGCH